ncbi:DUF3450 domain-containing protein [Endozoicomonas euniceicola]|uniref:DUF3450 domain-containing protein n=1 Tax=Endozoicomonas euniceicola TaxID=1234143 RepID=A0ABY6GR54_9GAMM|nr:DUF3450 domain-containing protein [Endozoicomonas euniceicola]UYM14479.1 DUF3450 domain-containing protein [Endozoicomonas euniceicola]
MKRLKQFYDALIAPDADAIYSLSVLRRYLLVLPLALMAGFAQASTSDLARLDQIIAKQLEVERSTAALQLEAQQSLTDNERLLTLYRQEHKALTKALAHKRQQQDEVDAQRNELLEAQVLQEKRTQQYQQQLEQGKTLLELQWQQLPPPLQYEFQGEWVVLQDKKQGLSERFAAMIAMLTKLEEFNSGINLHQGNLIHQGESWRTEKLFIGLAQGYYRLPDGSGAGVGYVVDGVWQWQSTPALQAQIDQAFAIYQGRQPVEFVTLPLPAVREGQP